MKRLASDAITVCLALLLVLCIGFTHDTPFEWVTLGLWVCLCWQVFSLSYPIYRGASY